MTDGRKVCEAGMTKQEILDKFSDIDFVYNDSSKHETLSRMLDVLLKEQEAVEPEVEGGGMTWYFVCGECHGAVDPKDKYCRSCGRGLKWER